MHACRESRLAFVLSHSVFLFRNLKSIRVFFKGADFFSFFNFLWLLVSHLQLALKGITSLNSCRAFLKSSYLYCFFKQFFSVQLTQPSFSCDRHRKLLPACKQTVSVDAALWSVWSQLDHVSIKSQRSEATKGFSPLMTGLRCSLQPATGWRHASGVATSTNRRPCIITSGFECYFCNSFPNGIFKIGICWTFLPTTFLIILSYFIICLLLLLLLYMVADRSVQG